MVCTRRLQRSFGRRRWPHRSESRWWPRRNEVAGAGEGDLIEVLPVVGRGVCEVQRWCVLERELGVPFYKGSESVAVNGVLRRVITAVQCSDDRLRG